MKKVTRKLRSLSRDEGRERAAAGLLAVLGETRTDMRLQGAVRRLRLPGTQTAGGGGFGAPGGEEKGGHGTDPLC